MSSIAVTASATGTGVVSLVAPVTNTNRTLTLPDATGTVAVASSGTPSATTFLNGDGAWATAGSPPGTVELLDEDTFTTSGTWTKAAGYDDDDTVMIFLTAGGGSGGAGYVTTDSMAATGGASGGCVVTAIRYADVPASAFTLVVGAGGAAATRSTAGGVSGSAGGETTLTLDSQQILFNCQGGSPGADGGTFGTAATITRAQEFYASTTAVGYGFGAYTTANLADIYTAFTSGGTLLRFINRVGGVTATSEYAALSAAQKLTNYSRYPNQVFGGGGSAARAGATNRTSWNPRVAALFSNGGNGSGTANGQDAIGMGGGGGACVRENATAVSGAGGNGGMIVRYYSGTVSPLQILNKVGV